MSLGWRGKVVGVTPSDERTAISVTETPTQEELAELKDHLMADTSKLAPFEMSRPVAAFVREAGELIAGISGHTYWGWLFIDRLWVAEAVRGRGIGGRLLQEVETEARRRGCRGAWLDTYSFQAKPFYEAQGYGQFGELDGYRPGFKRHFLWKPLA